MREVIERKEWLGFIPKEWGYIPGRFVFKPRNSKGNETEVLLAATQKQGMYPQHLLEGVVQVREGTDLQSFRTVHKNDYVISLRSFQGGFEMSDYEGVCSPAYQVFFNSKPIDHRYYKYLFKCQGFIQEMDSVTVGIREGKNIPYDSFARTYIPYPDLSEQSRIAAFLDDRCAKIDEAVARHKALIEKLDEYRKAVITKAVTKGMRGEREMKGSGVKWLPNIPLDWNIERTKFHFTNRKYVVGDKASEYERLALTLNGVIKRDKEDTDGLQPKEFGGYQILREGELVFKLIDLENVSTSRVGYSPYTGIVSPAYIILEKKKGIEPRYAEFYFLSLWMREIFNQIGDSGVRSSLNSKDLLELPIAFPSLDEQSEIVAFLDKKCAAIDFAKERHQQLINKLEEYKKSLIYNAVTGKIEC